MQRTHRKYIDAKYSYGFNGKENDTEVKGTGNSIDFGSRIYESRLGRWLSLDPLMSKYPELSPYHFSGNNPILYIDNDGRDFGVYVNHTDKTIIVKATLYSTKDEAYSAKNAAMSWNKQNGKYQYKLGDGPNAKYYDVKFEITVKESVDYDARDVAFSKDKSVEANRYDVVKDGDLGNNYGTTNPILEGGANDISVEKSTEKRKSGSHELGHAFGLGHWNKGLLKKGSERKVTEGQITKGNISKILTNIGIGKDLNDKTDTQTEAPINNAKSKITSTGNEPSNFNNGKVVEKKKK